MNVTHWEPLPNVSSVEPPMSINSLSSLLGVMEIAMEHIGAAHTHLEHQIQML